MSKVTQSRPQYTPDMKPSEYFGAPDDFVLPRKHDRDLAFEGWKLANARECVPRDVFVKNSEGALKAQNGEHCLEVTVYLTKTQRIVTHVRRWKQVGAEVLEEEHALAHHGTWEVAEAIAWLKKDNSGRLGPTSKEAWVKACAEWPGLAPEAAEPI